MTEDKEYIEKSERHLRIKYNVLFRAFLINFVVVFIVWLCSLWPTFMEFVSKVTNFSMTELDMYFINWLAAWDIAGVVLFLVPALATYWARFALRRTIETDD